MTGPATDFRLYHSNALDVLAGILADVLREPAPTALLANFGADGLEFTVGYWLRDVQNGQMGLRSDINRAILAALRANNIEIPFPQRVMHQR